MTRVRIATQHDREAIHDVHMSAFPDGENAPVARLATDLLDGASEHGTLHLVAESDSEIVGHAAFSPVFAQGHGGCVGYILSPLGVRPGHHGGGIGSRLLRRGLEMLSADGIDTVFVYGDPAYYGRFGFTAAAAQRFKPPFPLEFPFGWQAIAAEDRPGREAIIEISCVTPLNDPALW